MGAMIEIGIFLGLLALGLVAGRLTSRRHLQKLEVREARLSEMRTSDIKTRPDADPDRPGMTMVNAEVVIGSDYFITFLLKLRQILGGNIASYQSLMERAKREARIQLLEQAHEQGYNAVCNIRLQTADVGGGNYSSRLPLAPILAYGTAYHARVS